MKTIILVILFTILGYSLHSEEMERVKASSIGIETVLIGDCGVEIGKEFLIEAKFYTKKEKSHKEPEARRLLEIKSVNGVALKSKITEHLWDSTELKENKWYTLRVVETAQFSRFHTPNLSIDDLLSDEGRQIIYSGLNIIEIITN